MFLRSSQRKCAGDAVAQAEESGGALQRQSNARWRPSARIPWRIASPYLGLQVVRLMAGALTTVFLARPDAETFALDFVDSTAIGSAMYYLRVT
jgi:hypothetical protein